MPGAEGWLSLRVQDKPNSKDVHQKASLLISIPKKTVGLATQRNRIKRLIREVFRKLDRLDPGKAHLFKVMRYPGDPSLKETKDLMEKLAAAAKS